MANVLAIRDLSEVEANPTLNPQLETFEPVFKAFYTPVNFSFVTDTFTDNFPLAYPNRSVSAVKATSFKDDFYFKIRYFPNSISLGAITGNQEITVHVFSGFFEDKSLNQINIINGQGIELDGPALPTTYDPLHLQDYTLTVSDRGPATIDATIQFDWEVSVNDGDISVTGLRIVVYPYLFNKGMQESLSWNTQVITANNGEEQRIRVRNSPRQSFAINTYVDQSNWTSSDNLLYAWRGNVWGTPVFIESRLSNFPVSQNDLFIDVDTQFADFRDGGLGLIYESADNFQIVQIETVAPGGLNLSQVAGKTFDTNVTVVPIVPCRMVGDPIRQTSGNGVKIQTTFESIENVTLETSASIQQYNGFDVYTDSQLKINGTVSDTYQRRVDLLDFPSSNVETLSPWDRTKIQRQFGLLFDDLQQLWEFKLFLHRRAGRLRPFWTPTFEPNFEIVDTGLIGQVITVVNNNQSVFGESRRFIGLLVSGSWVFCEIQSFEILGDNLQLTIVENLQIESSDVELISYVGLKRLLADTAVITHDTNFVSNSNITIVEVAE